jgi:hypothetical protein
MGQQIKDQETYRDRVLKAIPSDVLGVFVAANGVVASTPEKLHWLYWVVFGLCLVATPLWLRFRDEVRSWLQLVLASIAFVIWSMTLGDAAFATIPGYPTVIGSVLLIVYSGIAAPLITKLIKGYR